MNIPFAPHSSNFPPRTVIFVNRDGAAFVSPAFPGAPKDYADIGLGQCNKDWNEIYQEFAACEHTEDFYDTAKRVQHYYDLPGWERKVLPVLSVPAGNPVEVGTASIYFVAEKAEYQQLTIEDPTEPPAPPVDEHEEGRDELPAREEELEPEPPEQIQESEVNAPAMDATPVPEPVEAPTEQTGPAVEEPEPPKQERKTVGRVTPGVNDLATVNPDIAAEWHYEKNAPITPSDISATSQKKMWWRCKVCSHEWETFVHNRALRNSSCPQCRAAKRGLSDVKKAKEAKPAPAKSNSTTEEKTTSEDKKPVNIRSLAIKNPKVAKEWHPTKNGSITPEDVNASSSQEFWFQCEKGHEWLARVDVRARGAKCPYCTGRIAMPASEAKKAAETPLSVKELKKAMDKPIAEPAKKEPATTASARTLTPKDFIAGDVVVHREHGRGVVQKVVPYPTTGDALIVIDFDGIGVKRLMFRAAIRFMEKLEN